MNPEAAAVHPVIVIHILLKLTGRTASLGQSWVLVGLFFIMGFYLTIMPTQDNPRSSGSSSVHPPYLNLRLVVRACLGQSWLLVGLVLLEDLI
jgi:hypothetical protein